MDKRNYKKYVDANFALPTRKDSSSNGRSVTFNLRNPTIHQTQNVSGVEAEHESARTPNFVDPTAFDEVFQSRSWIRVPDTFPNESRGSNGSGLIRSLLTRPDHMQLIDPDSRILRNTPFRSMMQRSSSRTRYSIRNLPYHVQAQNSIPSAFTAVIPGSRLNVRTTPGSPAIRSHRLPTEYYHRLRTNNNLQSVQPHRQAPSTSRPVRPGSVATQLGSDVGTSNSSAATQVQGASSGMMQRTPSTFPIDPVAFQVLFKQLARQGDVFAMSVMNVWNENGITDVVSVEDWRRVESDGVVLITDLAAWYYLSKLRAYSERLI